MSKIRIKNFGPIKDGYLENGGWMDIKKVTLFIGNQGSGKSTVAKLISTFMWMEKALNRGDFKITRPIDLLNRIYWHNLEDYFKPDTEIEYQGSKYCISYWKNKDLSNVGSTYLISEIENENNDSEQYVVPKIVYIPAERNFLSMVKEAFDLSGLPDPLADFSTDLRKAQYNLGGEKVSLPLNNLSYEFNKQNGNSYLHGEGFILKLLQASSGFFWARG